MERINRAYTDNIYLMETVPQNERARSLMKKFIVMGSTGNLYTVTVSAWPECTCPDFRIRKKRCKHIYFILMRVMKVIDERQQHYDQEELQEMFDNIPMVTRNLIPKAAVRKSYKTIKKSCGGDDEGEKPEEEEDEEDKKDEVKVVEQKPYVGEPCPICLDDLTGKEVDYCKYSCGKSIHTVCFKMWCKKNNNTCVYCREEWVKAIIVAPKVAKQKRGKKKDWLKVRGYINVLGSSVTPRNKSIPKATQLHISKSKSKPKKVPTPKVVPKTRAKSRSRSRSKPKKVKH